MVRRYLNALGALLLLAAFTPAMAQYYYQGSADRPLQWQIEGGTGITEGTTANYLDNGWTLGGGVSWFPSPATPLGLRLDASYSQFGATGNLINLGSDATETQIDAGVGRVWGADLDAEIDLPLSAYVRPYLLGGIGVYQRQVELYQTAFGGGPYCDPWFGFCGGGFFPANAPIARTTTNGEFSWNAGAGIAMPLGGGMSWFVEARFRQIGPPDERTAFWPITVGLRF